MTTPLGARLAQARKERGLLLKQVAARISFSLPTYHQLETGRHRTLTLVMAVELSDTLDIPLEELYLLARSMLEEDLPADRKLSPVRRHPFKSQPMTPKPYTPPKMVTHRPGAERALELPSRVDGKTQPHVPPKHVCSGTTQRTWLGH